MVFLKKHNLTKYIKGRGAEIGALHNPLKVNRKKVQVIYVDMLDKEDLIKQNPEICSKEIKSPDIVADAEDLNVIADESMDFVIASHILEHLPNPIKALKEFHGILKMGGILYLAIPDKRCSFDRERPITALSHLLQDYKERATPETSILHYQEWLTLVELKKEKPVVKCLEDLMNKQYRIHFHVWVPESILELLNYLKNNLRVYFQLEDYYYRKGDMEIIFILKKVSCSSFSDLPCSLKEKYSLIRIHSCKVFNLISIILCYLKKILKRLRCLTITFISSRWSSRVLRI
jgi:SAM-dependent methyltransferase